MRLFNGTGIRNYTQPGTLQPPTIRYGRAPTPKVGVPARTVRKPTFWPSPTGGPAPVQATKPVRGS